MGAIRLVSMAAVCTETENGCEIVSDTSEDDLGIGIRELEVQGNGEGTEESRESG